MNTNRRPKGVDAARVQAHYDLSDEFFALFLDPSMMYSCAKFDTPETSLADAQRAKIDLSLVKCELRPGHRLLDIGCGWGATALRAVEKYGVSVTGLTVSRNHLARCQKLAGGRPGLEFRLQGWEEFEGKADRIVSIGAFEHFGHDRYRDFFAMAHAVLPTDGVMLLHTITRLTLEELEDNDIPLSMDAARFARFIATEIFPGGQLPTIEAVQQHAADAGFSTTRVQSLQQHYARTLDVWAASLAQHRAEAIAVQSEQVYERYMRYLTGCADMFRRGYIDVNQFTLAK
jgi:cyclopropane-fatty-acyl-phospholipid synthase